MATSIDAPAGRAATPAWSGDRLPVAPRQRRPGLAILAVVLILGGALFSAALVLRSGAKQSVIEVVNDVPEGQRFALTDLRQVQVAPGPVAVVRWSHVREVVGKTAAADIKRGTLLHPGLLGIDPLPRSGTAIVPAAFKAGQLPSLSPGDKVSVLWAPQAGSDPKEAPRYPTTGVVVDGAIVYSVSRVHPDGTAIVQLVIPLSKVSDFARFATLQSLTLAKPYQGG